jgi:hypothetical protein
MRAELGARKTREHGAKPPMMMRCHALPLTRDNGTARLEKDSEVLRASLKAAYARRNEEYRALLTIFVTSSYVQPLAT